MNNLIYQVWTGTLTEECRVSSKLMRAYAERIGADYLLDVNVNIADKLTDMPGCYEWLNPLLHEKFLKYDKILSVDLDVFPIQGTTESIFEQDIADTGICIERIQPKQRASVSIAGINSENDEKWASALESLYKIELPRNEDGDLIIYNAGIVLFNHSLIAKSKKWMPFQEYINWMRSLKLPKFYYMDQDYFHAMMCCNKDIEFTIMSNKWNSPIHYLRGPMSKNQKLNDERDENTVLIHLQMTGMKWDEDSLYQVINKPEKEWTFKY